jgi:hypothetical protein
VSNLFDRLLQGRSELESAGTVVLQKMKGHPRR